MGNNIVLVGMSGSGKTFICNLLSERLTQYLPIDIDSYIEKTTGMKICEIFSKYSEDYFRKLEYDAIKLVCNGENKIISTGGGAFENPDNRSTLLKFGTVFYLKSDLDVLYYRISKDNTRPLLNCANPREALAKLLAKREANYRKAHYVVDTSSVEAEDAVNYILGCMNEPKTSC